MIIKVDRQHPRFCIGLRAAGCDGASVKCEDYSIIVYRLSPGPIVFAPGVWDEGCGNFRPGRQVYAWRLPPRRIRYPAFEVDMEGRVCFLWDDKILDGERGRWQGVIHCCDQPIAVVEFQVGGRVIVESVEAVPVEEC